MQLPIAMSCILQMTLFSAVETNFSPPFHLSHTLDSLIIDKRWHKIYSFIIVLVFVLACMGVKTPHQIPR